jgi:NADH-quinone oxidoreductase subunit M
MGPLKYNTDEKDDARWNEKWAAVILIAGIIIMGMAPFWLNDLVSPGVELITNKLAGK